MKNRIIYLILILFFQVTSCSNSFLNEKALTEITSTEVYTTQAGLELAVVALYDIQRTFYTNENTAASIGRGDELTATFCCHDSGVAHYDATLSPNSATFGFVWRLNYSIIERANSIIKGVENVSMPEAVKTKLLAETYMFRAQAYFNLIRNFDNIPLLTESTTAIRRDFTPAPPEDVWNLIVSDLDFASANLSYQVVAGRYGKGAAQHLRADVALWMKDWKTAADNAISLINDGPYKLLTDPKGVFVGSSINHQETPETIYAIKFAKGIVGGGGNGHLLSEFFTTQYHVIRGMKATLENGRTGYARTLPNDYLMSLYESKDKRLDAYYKRFWTYNNPATLPAGKKIGDTVLKSAVTDPFRQLSPCPTKYWDMDRELGTPTSTKDVIRMRLAQTYLFAAEALMRQGGKDSQALFYLNKVRGRAGLDDLTQIDENAILDEEARELSFEGHRWYLLKRTGKLVERLRLHGGNSRYPMVRTNIQEYHVRRPIPQSELDLMDNYPQNEGYN